jgi:flagellar biosynthesis/type III secretory pathway protein FliH
MGLEYKDSNFARAHREKGIEEGIEKGREEGIKKGRLEEKINTTQLQIKRKFKLDILSDELNNFIKNAEPEVLDGFKELIFDMETLEDVINYFSEKRNDGK